MVGRMLERYFSPLSPKSVIGMFLGILGDAVAGSRYILAQVQR
jgi:hypothetical protein